MVRKSSTKKRWHFPLLRSYTLRQYPIYDTRTRSSRSKSWLTGRSLPKYSKAIFSFAHNSTRIILDKKNATSFLFLKFSRPQCVAIQESAALQLHELLLGSWGTKLNHPHRNLWKLLAAGLLFQPRSSSSIPDIVKIIQFLKRRKSRWYNMWSLNKTRLKLSIKSVKWAFDERKKRAGILPRFLCQLN